MGKEKFTQQQWVLYSSILSMDPGYNSEEWNDLMYDVFVSVGNFSTVYLVSTTRRGGTDSGNKMFNLVY